MATVAPSGMSATACSGDATILFIEGSLPGVSRGLTHRPQICLAARLEQSVHAAVEVLDAEAEELRDEIVGAAASGDASGAGDRLHAALHHLLHLGVSLLSGKTHGLRKVPGADEVHVHTGHLHEIRQVLDRLDFFEHQAYEGLAVGFPGIVRRGALEAVAGGPAATEDSAVTLRRVLHCVYCRPRFIRGIDVRNLHAPGAAIEERRDDLGLVPDRAHDGRHAAEL